MMDLGRFKRVKRSAQRGVSRAFDMPESVFNGTAQMELYGNSEAVIQGCKGIVEYDEDLIRLDTGNLVIRFRGAGLEIKCFTEVQTVVRGQFISIDFQ